MGGRTSRCFISAGVSLGPFDAALGFFRALLTGFFLAPAPAPDPDPEALPGADTCLTLKGTGCAAVREFGVGWCAAVAATSGGSGNEASASNADSSAVAYVVSAMTESGAATDAVMVGCAVATLAGPAESREARSSLRSRTLAGASARGRSDQSTVNAFMRRPYRNELKDSPNTLRDSPIVCHCARLASSAVVSSPSWPSARSRCARAGGNDDDPPVRLLDGDAPMLPREIRRIGVCGREDDSDMVGGCWLVAGGWWQVVVVRRGVSSLHDSPAQPTTRCCGEINTQPRAGGSTRRRGHEILHVVTCAHHVLRQINWSRRRSLPSPAWFELLPISALPV